MNDDNANMLEVWRLHPYGCRVERADGTVGGHAPMSARRYCGPYIHANGAGFYLYSPVDIDIVYCGDDRWEYTVAGTFWSDAEVLVADTLCPAGLTPKDGAFLPRTKLFLSGAGSEPRPAAQLWTGCIFNTPPGWALWLRAPINRAETWPFVIEEAVLETSWLHQDIWLNLRFREVGAVARLRRDGPPIAQLVPIPQQSYAPWELRERDFAADDPEAEDMFNWWLAYNREKFCGKPDGAKDSQIYYRRRRQERH